MSRSTQTDRPKNSTQDALSHVTAEIARFLEQGVMPWRAPWDANLALAATPGLPLRSTGEPYRGANVVLLWAAQIARGYSRRTWLTFRQALALGGHVRKGEKACPVIYYGQAAPKDESGRPPATGDDGKPAPAYRFLKLFHVFNLDQIDDLPEGFAFEPPTPQMREPQAFELWIKRAGARLRIGGAQAFYAPATDTIHVPPIAAFRDPEQFNSTIGHEAVHFTGHPSRFDRLADYHIDRKARAREELIAEIGSAVLGAMAGFRPDHLEDHAAYVSSWLDLVRDEPRAFLSAGAKAQAAVDWLVERAGQPSAPCPELEHAIS